MASGETFYDTKTETFLPGARCDIEQYRMLQRCSKAKDISEWNQWRKTHHDEDIWLVRADLGGFHLDGAYLDKAHLNGAHLEGAHLDGANLWEAHLDGADLALAHLDGANLEGGHLNGADLQEAHLDGAHLLFAHLDGARLTFAHLDGANLWWAHLDGANFLEAYLGGADFSFAHLDGTNLSRADLRGADFRAASVDGTTLLWGNAIDRKTDFTGVGLAGARVEPGLKQLLEYNVRRIGWKKWYQHHRALRWPVRFFWALSDYGLSTGRIVAWFFSLALLFAALYYVWGLADPPGIVTSLFEADGQAVGPWVVPLRAAYFSVVTMTTLGFGDMYAQANGVWGHVPLMCQVLLGYVLLGALVTRFAVLFTAGGPAGQFSPKPKKKRRKDEA